MHRLQKSPDGVPVAVDALLEVLLALVLEKTIPSLTIQEEIIDNHLSNKSAERIPSHKATGFPKLSYLELSTELPGSPLLSPYQEVVGSNPVMGKKN